VLARYHVVTLLLSTATGQRRLLTKPCTQRLACNMLAHGPAGPLTWLGDARARLLCVLARHHVATLQLGTGCCLERSCHHLALSGWLETCWRVVQWVHSHGLGMQGGYTRWFIDHSMDTSWSGRVAFVYRSAHVVIPLLYAAVCVGAASCVDPAAACTVRLRVRLLPSSCTQQVAWNLTPQAAAVEHTGCAVLCCAVLCCAVLYCAAPCCAVLCCAAVLCCVGLGRNLS
jgi:hypothetical protein